MRQNIETSLQFCKDPKKQEVFKKYLKYINWLSSEDLALLDKFEEKLQSKAEMVCEEFSSKVWELLYGELCFEDFTAFLEWKIPEFEKQDNKKRESWLSGSMWRLAMTEWNEETSLDTPILKREISKIKALYYSVL